MANGFLIWKVQLHHMDGLNYNKSIFSLLYVYTFILLFTLHKPYKKILHSLECAFMIFSLRSFLSWFGIVRASVDMINMAENIINNNNKISFLCALLMICETNFVFCHNSTTLIINKNIHLATWQVNVRIKNIILFFFAIFINYILPWRLMT